RTILNHGLGPPDGSRRKKDGPDCGNRSHPRSTRRSGAALLQREALEADRPGLATALFVRLAPRFPDEYRHQVPRPRGCFADAAASQLARAEERATHPDEHADEVCGRRAARGGESEESVSQLR